MIPLPGFLTWTNIKLGAVAAAGIVMAVLYALLQKSEREKQAIQTKVQTKSTAIKIKAAKKLSDGLQKEAEVMQKPVDTTKRDHFG